LLPVLYFLEKIQKKNQKKYFHSHILYLFLLSLFISLFFIIHFFSWLLLHPFPNYKWLAFFLFSLWTCVSNFEGKILKTILRNILTFCLTCDFFPFQAGMHLHAKCIEMCGLWGKYLNISLTRFSSIYNLAKSSCNTKRYKNLFYVYYSSK